MSEEIPEYKKEIYALLDNYVDGREIFIKAKDWDHPVALKPGVEDASLPQSWLELADRVIGIVAHKKYGLDTYPNLIEIVDYEQMLDAMSTSGMIGYDHWSIGKAREQIGKSYERAESGLPYELIVNTNPAVAYCMAGNTKVLQLLVIAHASYGHNSFFKNNHMFRQFTRADDILTDLLQFRTFLRGCEEKHGAERVERLLDACHALEWYAVDRYTKPRPHSPQEEVTRRARIETAREKSVDINTDWTLEEKTTSKAFNAAAEKKIVTPGGEENILRFIASYAPHLEDWERQVMREYCNRAQYFYPQIQTKVMNEGWASYWHYKLMNDLYEDLGLMDAGMNIDFLMSHTAVVRQVGFDHPGYSGINPYYLGFKIYEDIERICKDPTEEDRKWFPAFAGKADQWLGVMKGAADGFKDESWIHQYLSPKVMRDMKMFALLDDSREATFLVEAIHNEKGYRQVRENLAAQYDFSSIVPDVVVSDYKYRTDRSLVLRHNMHDRRPVEIGDAKDVLRHVYYLWKHPVVLESVRDDDSVERIIKHPPDPPAPKPPIVPAPYGFR